MATTPLSLPLANALYNTVPTTDPLHYININKTLNTAGWRTYHQHQRLPKMLTGNRGELGLKGSDAGDASFGSDTDSSFEAGVAGSGLPRALRPPDSRL